MKFRFGIIVEKGICTKSNRVRTYRGIIINFVCYGWDSGHIES